MQIKVREIKYFLLGIYFSVYHLSSARQFYNARTMVLTTDMGYTADQCDRFTLVFELLGARGCYDIIQEEPFLLIQIPFRFTLTGIFSRLSVVVRQNLGTSQKCVIASAYEQLCPAMNNKPHLFVVSFAAVIGQQLRQSTDGCCRAEHSSPQH